MSVQPHPAAHAVSLRRRSLLGGVATLPFARSAAAALPQTGPAADTAWFFRLSQAVTGHDDLDRDTARRMAQAMAASDPGFTAQAEALAALVQPGQDPEALLAAADAAGLKPRMMAIVTAWYTGSVGESSAGITLTYADALLYRQVIDATPAQTYCGGGPLWWTAQIPPLGIPIVATAPKAATP